MKTQLIAIVWTTIIICATVHAAPPGAAATLHDTVQPATPGEKASSLADGSWKLIGPDAAGHSFQGDAVLVNDRLAAILRKDGSGVDLYAKGPDGWTRRGSLVPVIGRAPKKLTGLKAAAAGGVEAGVEGASGAGLVFVMSQPGFPAVKVTPRGKVEALRFVAPCRFGILPDFYADDIMIDAGNIPVERAEIPSDHIFLHLAGDRDAIVAAVWEKGDRDLELALKGEGPDRMIASTDVFFEEGGSIYAAVLEQKSIWYSMNFDPGKMKRGTKLDWAVPFIAKWKGDFVLGDGTIYSRQFKYGGTWYDGPVDKLDGRGKDLTVVLQRDMHEYVSPDTDARAVAHSVMAAYPISREEQTPLEQLCIDDLLRLLGTEVCAYVLDLDGRAGDARPGHETGIFTCNHDVLTSTIMPTKYPRNEQALAEFFKDERVYFREIDEQVIVFIKHIEDRINSYIAFRRDLLAYLDEQAPKHPDLAPFIERMKKQLTDKVPVFSKFEPWDKLADGVERAMPTIEKRRRALRVGIPEEAPEADIALRWIGDPQDARVRSERMNAIRIRTMASMEMAMNPAAAEIAKEVRKRTQEILRNAPAHEKPITW